MSTPALTADWEFPDCYSPAANDECFYGGNGGPWTRTKFAYDGLGELTSIEYPSGLTVFYDRGPDGRVSGVRARRVGGEVVQLAQGITYKPFGPIDSLILGNGISSRRDHDFDYRVSILTDATIFNRSHEYSDRDEITQISDLSAEVLASSDRLKTYTYDELSRLTSSLTLAGSQSFEYDPLGNRLQELHAGASQSLLETYHYEAGSNRLLSTTGTIPSLGLDLGAGLGATLSPVLKGIEDSDDVSYQFDAMGNVIQKGDLRFSYDTSARMASVVRIPNSGGALGLPASPVPIPVIDWMRYSPDATRLDKKTAVTHIRYHYDLNGALIAESAVGGGVIREYVYLDAKPLAAVFTQLSALGVSPPAENQIAYYHVDHLGTPQLMTDQEGDVVWNAIIEPFGQTTPTAVQVTNNLRFAGQYFDLETGFHYNLHRYYDPSTGRYVTADPIGLRGGLNPYLYVGANSVADTDPTGLSPAGAAVTGGAGGSLVGGVIAGIPSSPSQQINPVTIPDNIFVPACIANPLCSIFLMNSVGSGNVSDSSSESDETCKGNDDFCYQRWDEEDKACWQWKNLGSRVVAACKSRAATRRDLCFRNGGKPDPDEPAEYNPFVDYPR